MNISQVKKALEDAYFIGFNVKGDPKKFCVTLDGTSYDRFQMKCEVKDNIRLNIEVEPEKFGANFLRLLNYSDFTKRQGFSALYNSVNSGELGVYINDRKVTINEFEKDQSIWESFRIKYTLIPFDENQMNTEVFVSLCGMILSLVDYTVDGFEEGKAIEVRSTKYERNPINRKICLAKKGYKCCICGFDFEKFYGEVGKETIEVHHTKQVSQMGANYRVDPINELEPVCSNCHTIIHKRKEPYTIEEVKQMIEKKLD